MTALRTAAQQALEALDGLSEDAVCQSSHHAKKDRHTSLDVCPVFLRLRAAITALRAALAQQDESDAYGYASYLAVAIWEKYYKDTAPQWKLLDDLMGVLTQIDNMTSGLTRLAQQAEPVEPVAHRAFLERILTAMEGVIDVADRKTDEFDALRSCVIDLTLMLHTAPPQRKLVPLTETEIEHIGITHQSLRQVARAVERAVWEKNNG